MALQYRLNAKEIEVIALLCAGATRNKDIASYLHRDVETVKARLRMIFGKTRTRDRLNLLLWAKQNGIGGGFGGWDDGKQGLGDENDCEGQRRYEFCS